MTKTLAENRRARFDYDILETLEAGIKLFGFEVKSVKNKGIALPGSYVVRQRNDLVLLNAEISPYQSNNTPLGYESRRTRRLLIRREEIERITGKLEDKGTLLIPLRAYLKNNLIKLELGLVRPRKKYDKRELLKKRTHEREMQRAQSNSLQ